MTNESPRFRGASLPPGSGVTLKSRLRRYSRRLVGVRPPAMTGAATRAECVRVTWVSSSGARGRNVPCGSAAVTGSWLHSRSTDPKRGAACGDAPAARSFDDLREPFDTEILLTN